MAEKKYIEAWNEVPGHFCPHIAVIKEALAEDSDNPGPHARNSDNLRREAMEYLQENACAFVKTGRCALSDFFTKKGVKAEGTYIQIRKEF